MKRELVLCALLAGAALGSGTAPASEDCGGGVMTRLPDRLQAAPKLRVEAESHTARRDADPEPPAVGTITFERDRRFFVKHPVDGLAAGDFNGDGLLDFASVSWDSMSVNVLIGTPDKAFEEPLVLALPSWPLSVAAGDLDRDGADELVIALFYAEQIVIAGLEAGRLRIMRAVAAGPGPTASVVADLDRDGWPEVTVSNWWDNTLSVFRNAGKGTLGPPQNYFTGMGPDNPIAVDLDGDGDLDIVTADAGCLSVSALLNRGDGTFRPRVTSMLPGNATSVAAGDLDGDGDPDLVATCHWELIVLENTGGGRFRPEAHLNPRESWTYGVAITDLDRDGRHDVVAAAFGTHYPTESRQKLAVFLNEGGWKFAPEVDYSTGHQPVRILVRDVDDDGMLDVVTGNLGHPYGGAKAGVSILYGRLSGTLGSFTDIGIPGANAYDYSADPVSSVHAASFGPGERPQFLVGRFWSTDLVEDDGRGRYRITEVIPNSILATLDVNSDGITDVLAGRADQAGVIEVWLGAADRTFSSVARYTDSKFAATLDFDGNGLPDIVMFDESDTLTLRRSLGGGLFGEPENLGVHFDPYLDISVAGRNLDGKRGDELLVSRNSPWGIDSVTVWINRNGKNYERGLGVPVQPSEPSYYWYSHRPRYLAFGDVDRNGTMDVLVLATSSSGGYFGVLANDGSGQLSLVDYEDWVGSEPAGFVVEDFDRDGWLDAAVADANSGAPGRFAVYQGVGAGRFEYLATYYPGDYPVGITSADIDANGMPDLALVTSAKGLLVKVMNGGPPPAPVQLRASVEGVVTDVSGVRVEWSVSGLDVAAVERTTRGIHWEPFGAAEVTGPGRFRVVDPGPGRGMTGYRLVATKPGIEIVGSEVWVNPRTSPLVVRGMGLVPGPGGPEVELEIERAGPVHVELFDLSGRRVLAQPAEWVPAGTQVVQLPGARGLAQGVYWVRARQEGNEARGRVVVVR